MDRYMPPDEVHDERGLKYAILEHRFIRDHGRAIGPYGIAVYVALLSFAGYDSHQGYPSLKRLSELTGMTRRKVINVIQDLQDKALIKVTKRLVGKRHTTNIYTLLPLPSPSESDAPRSEYDSPGSEYHSPSDSEYGSLGSEYGSPKDYVFKSNQLEEYILPPTQIVDGPPTPETPEVPRKTTAADKKPKKTACPDTYKPTDAQVMHATKHGIDLDTEIKRFLHNHRGKGSRMVSWEDAFWTWLHNYDDFKPRRRTPATTEPLPEDYPFPGDPPPPPPEDRLMQCVADMERGGRCPEFIPVGGPNYYCGVHQPEEEQI